MLFSDIPGLKSVKNQLTQAVRKGKVAHGLLLDGNPGSGALALALAFATYIQCENKGEEDSCGECPSCQKMEKLIHPDVHLVFPCPNIAGRKLSEHFINEFREFVETSPYQTLGQWLKFLEADDKQAVIPVEEARSILSKLTLTAYEGGHKIIIIWKPEMMNISSANALLKILEEPAPKTLFFLVSDQPDQLLPTIISRVQQIWVPLFTDQDVKQYLTEQLELEEQWVPEVVYMSDGSLAEAYRSIYEYNQPHTWFREWMTACYRRNVNGMIEKADDFDDLSREREKELLEYALRVFRDTLLIKSGANSLIRAEDSQKVFLENFSRSFHEKYLPQIVREISNALYHIESNVRAKMVFLDLSLTLSQLLKKE